MTQRAVSRRDIPEKIRIKPGTRPKLSDADAFNWTAIEAMSMVVFVLVLLRVAYLPNPEAGTIFAMFFYVWRLMEKLDLSPQIVQQLMRLKDIRQRIEAGMPVEAIGAGIARDEDRRPPAA